MDIKRSNRIKKAAAIAALVLVVGGASIAAEVGNAGLFAGDVVSAYDLSETEYAISSQDSLEAFLKPDQKLTRGVITKDFAVSKNMGELKDGKTLYGDGKTITLTGGKALFNKIQNGAKIENVIITTKGSATATDYKYHIESDKEVGAVCCINEGEIRYVTVDAVVYSKYNEDHNASAAGLICGINQNNGKIFGCIVDGILDTRNNYAGSICGQNTANIERCTSSADVRFSTNGRKCKDYLDEEYDGEYSTTNIGGLVGYNNWKIYDCLFQGLLPIEYDKSRTVFYDDKGNVVINESDAKYKVVYNRVVEGYVYSYIEYKKAGYWYYNESGYTQDSCNQDDHDARSIGGLCGYLDEKGYIRNSLYNGKREISRSGCENADSYLRRINENRRLMNGYDCVGTRASSPQNMANSFRIDTYYIDGNPNNVKKYWNHYHETNYPDDAHEVTDYTIGNFTNGVALGKLNAGYATDQRPTDEDCLGDVWEAGRLFPQLCLYADRIVYKASDDVEIPYNGLEQPLIENVKIERGVGEIEYRLGDKGEWSKNIPTAKDSGSYKVYYRIKAGNSRYRSVPENIDDNKAKYNYINVTITKVPLTVKFEENQLIGYTGDKVYPEYEVTGFVNEEDKAKYEISVKPEGKSDLTKIGDQKVKVTIKKKDPATHENYTYKDTVISYKITKTNIDYTGISVTANELTYNAEEQKLVNVGKLPAGITKLDFKVEDRETRKEVQFRLKEGVPALINAGKYTVKYKAIADDYHNIVDNDWRSVDVDVDKVNLNVNYTADQSFEYSGSIIYPTYKVEGFVNKADEAKYSINVVAEGAHDLTNAGKQAVIVMIAKKNAADVENYTYKDTVVPYEITKTGVAITTVSVKANDLTYNGKAQELVAVTKPDEIVSVNYTVKDKETKETVEFELVNGVPAVTNAGTYIVEYTAVADDNHYVTGGSGSEEVEVKKVDLTVDYAKNQEFTYDGSEHYPVYEVKGFVNEEDKAKYTVSVVKAGTSDLISAGAQTVTVKITKNNEADAENYNYEDTDIAYSITKAGVSISAVSVNANDLTYNGKAQELVAVTKPDEIVSVNYTVKDKETKETVEFELVNGVPAVTNAGTYIVEYTAVADDNHYVTGGSGSEEVEVKKVDLTVDYAKDQEFTYDGSEHYPVYEVNGFVNEEDKAKYTVSVVKAGTSDLISAGAQTVTVKITKNNEADAENYNYEDTDIAYSITKAGVSISAVSVNANDLTYNGKAQELVAVTKPDEIVSVNYTVKDKETKETVEFELVNGVPAVTNAGTYIVEYTAVADDNHYVTGGSGSEEVEVKKVDLTVDYAKDQEFTYDGSEHYPVYEVKEFVNEEDKAKYTVSVVKAGTSDLISAGAQTVTVKITKNNEADAENYNYEDTDIAYSITKAGVSISAVSVNANDLTYNGKAQELVAVTKPDEIVSVNYTVKDKETKETVEFELVNGVPAVTNAGTYIVEYTAVADDNHYVTGGSGSEEVEVKKVDLTVDYAKDQEFTYDGSEHYPVYEVKGFVNEEDKAKYTVSVVKAGTSDLISAGAQTVTVKITKNNEADAENYNYEDTDIAYSITKAGVSISAVSVNANDLTYNGKAQELVAVTKPDEIVSVNYTVKDKETKETVEFELVNGVPAVTNAGTYIVEYTAVADDNHYVTGGSGSEEVEVKKVDLTVDYAKDQEFTYDGSEHYPVYEVNGFVNEEDKAKYTVSVVKAGTSDLISAGAQTVTVKITKNNEADAENYNYEDTDIAYSITKAGVSISAVSVNANDLTYNGKAQELVAVTKPDEIVSVNYSVKDKETKETVEFELVNGVPAVTNAGTYIVEYTAVADDNHYVTGGSGSEEVEVKKVDLTVDYAKNQEFTYDGSEHYPVYEVKGFVNEEDKAKYTVSVVKAGTSDLISAGAQTVTVKITKNNEADAENYNYEDTDIAYSITKAGVSISAVSVNANDLTYNGKAQELVAVTKPDEIVSVNYSVKDKETKETVEFELVNGVPAVTNAGTYIVEYTAVADDNHYVTGGSGSEEVEVKKVKLTVDFEPDQSFTYTGSPIYPDYEVIGFVGEDAGKYKVEAVAAEGKNLTDADAQEVTVKITKTVVEAAENYSYEDTPIAYTITKAGVSTAITVKALSPIYDGTAQALVDSKLSNGISEVRYVVKQGEKEVGTFVNEIPTAINAGTYTVEYTVTADDNHTLTSSATGSVDVKIAPRDIAVDWTGSQNEFTYGETITYGEEGAIKAKFVGINDEVGIVPQDARKESVKPAYHGLDKVDAGTNYEASVTIADPNYNIKYGNPFLYSIIAKKTDSEVVKALGETYTGSNQPLVEVTPVEGLTVTFDSVEKDNAAFELKVVDGVPVAKDAGNYVVKYTVTADKNHSLKDAEGNVLRDEEGNELKKKTGSVSVTIAKAELTVEWLKGTEKESFTFDPSLAAHEYQVPSIKPVTGYKNTDDEKTYALTVVPVTDGRNASKHQVAKVVFAKTNTAESDNYYFSIKDKEYEILQNTFEDLADKIKDVPVTVGYGETSKVSAVIAELESELVKQLGKNYKDKYVFTPDSFEFKDENGNVLDGNTVLDVNNENEPYTAEIKYTLNSDGQADPNYNGSFKGIVNVTAAVATVDVQPVENIIYDADEHALVTNNSKNCQISYTLNKVDRIGGGVPKAIDAGNYVVKYKVTPDANYQLPENVKDSGEFTVSIAQKDVTFTWSGENKFVYNTDIDITATPNGICEADKNKVDVVVDVPAAKGSNIGKYTATATLADKKNENAAGTEAFASVLGNYNVTDKGFGFEIVKATPSVELKDVYTATYGDKLSDLNDQLPQSDPTKGTYSWENENSPVGDAGDNTHTIVYTPSDTDNNEVVKTKVTVVVGPRPVHVIWNINNGEKFTFNGKAQNVDAYADLNDVFDKDEPSFKLDITADDLVNAGEKHKAVAAIKDINNNAKNYKIVDGDESRTFDILKSSSLQDMNYSETYEYGTTAKEIFDDLFEKHFGDFTKLAEDYSIDPNTVVVYKNGTKIDTEKLQNYAKSCFKARNLIYDKDVVDQINKLGKSFYNKPDFNVANNINDYLQIKQLVDTNRDSIKKFISAGALPGKEKYNKLITLFEKYEAVREAEDVMQGVGDYKITVSYNYMANKNEQSLERFLKLSGNYHPATLTAEVKITPCVIESLYADIESRDYNGDTNVDVNRFTFISKKNGKDKEWTLGGFDASGTAFVSPNAGTDKIKTEMTLRNENFCFGYDKTGKPVMTKNFSDVATNGRIRKAAFDYIVNLEGFAGERLSTIAVPSIMHGTFKWNDTETLIREGANEVAAAEFTFTPNNDEFNNNHDIKITVKVNGVKKPVETVVETQTVVETEIVTAVETVIVTDETKPAETTVTTASTDDKKTPVVTDVTTGETKAATTTAVESEKAVTTASTETTKQSVTEATTDAKTTDLPEITLPASTTEKLMSEVTDAPVIVTKPADTTAKTDDGKKAVTTAATESTKAAETTVSTATVTLPESKAVTTAATESTKPAATEATKADDTKAVTTVATETTKAAETTVSTATVTLPESKAVTTASTESTKPADTESTKPVQTEAAKTDDTKPVTTAATEAVTTAETTVSTATVTLPETTTAATTVTTAAATTASVTTAETKADTTAKTEETTAEVTTAKTSTVTEAETTVTTTEEVTTAEPVATAAETTTVTEATTAETTTSETTSEVTEVTPAATLPTLPEITLPEVTTEKLMGDVTEAVVTEAVTTSEVTTEAVTTPAVTEKADLEKIREIVINEPERVTKEVREDEKISLNGEEIKLALEDKMFFQGTESFDYPVRLKDFNAEKAFFDYAGFGFELPEGFSIDPDSLTTDLKGNIKYYAPDSIEALALAAKTNYTANGGYVVFRGVETRSLDPDAVLFTVKVKVADTLNVCVSNIGVSALYGRLTENSKFVEDGKVEPHVAFLDNKAGEQLYTKAESSVCMGVKGDVNLDGRVSQVDATIVLREILSLEVFKTSLLAENIDHHDGTAEEAVELSHFLGNVNQSPNGLFTQIDATSILRAILERDLKNAEIVDEATWKKVTNK